MDQLKLIQFNKFTKNSEQYDYAGYTYLHFAAKNSDSASINELLRRNADLVKQGSKDGQTPLHIVSHKLKGTSNVIWSFVGKLKKNDFVDALLSAQVKNRIALNPKCKHDLSHLHIACIYNYTEAIKLFLDNKESVNHSTNAKHPLPGYAALHFAVRYSSYEAAELLLKHGADVHLRDCEGRSVLHCLIRRLMDIADYLVIGKMSYYPFYEQERNVLESILLLILKPKKSQITSAPDVIGLTALHVACTLNSPTIAKKIIKQKMDISVATKIDSKLWPGWTPLHFAACFSIETFKLLLSRDADFKVKNAKEERPLDLCMQRYSPHIVHSILSLREDFKNILFTDGLTKLLDTVLIMTNDCMFKKWLDDLPSRDISVPLDSPIWPGCNLLHLAVLNERIRLETKYRDQMIFDDIYSLDRIEVALLQCCKTIISNLLHHCSLTKKNADGLTPFELALKLDKRYSLKKFLDSRRDDADDPGDLTRFHIACAAGNRETVEWFLEEREVDVDAPVKRSFQWRADDVWNSLVSVRAGSTPLHIAVIFDREELAEYLLEEKAAEKFAEDSLGLTPIHLCLLHKRFSSTVPRTLLKETEDLRDLVTKDGLSHLHVAAYHNDVLAIKELLRNGANVNVRFQPSDPEVEAMFPEFVGKTPLQVTMSKGRYETVEALIQAGADVFAESGKRSRTLLHLAMSRFELDRFLPKLKLKKGRVVGKIDEESGVTMLHFACLQLDVEWASELLRRGADANARVSADFGGDWSGSAPLDVLAWKFSRGCKDPGGFVKLLELLIKYGADGNAKNARGSTLLHVIHGETYERSSLFWKEVEPKPLYFTVIDMLTKSQKTYDVNPRNRYGLSHFHMACQSCELKILKKYLDAGVEVDHSCDLFMDVEHHAGWTPLLFACERKRSDVACLLIERGANVKVEDVRGNTPLHVVLKRGCFDVKLVKLLLRRGADINAKNLEGIYPIQYLMMSEGFTLGLFKLMLDQGATIDLADMKVSDAGIIGLAMKNAKPTGRLQVFKRMIAACDMKNAIKSGCNAIESAVDIEHEGQLTVDFYLNVIQQLVDVGCDVDQKDQEGKTALHRAVNLYNYEAVKALLLLGANFNIVDKNDEPPLTKKVLECYQLNDRRSSTLILLATQIWKVANMGLNVSECNRAALMRIVRQFSIDYDSVRSACLDELEKTKKTYIDEEYEISLRDFLSETEAVSEYSRLSLVGRRAIDSAFKNGNVLRRLFPEWAGFLTMQYRKAVARAEMIKPAIRVIFLAGIKLPTHILKEIAEYLNHDELKVLVGKPV